MQLLPIHLQPFLKNNLVIVVPLLPLHFEALFAAAADPLIWEQHPNKNRWQLHDFENYFKGALESAGALLVMDAVTNEIIGCSRYYNYDAATNNICIGYTFFVRSHWGSGYNYALKELGSPYNYVIHTGVYFVKNLLYQKPRNGIKYAQNGADKILFKCTKIYYLNILTMFS